MLNKFFFSKKMQVFWSDCKELQKTCALRELHTMFALIFITHEARKFLTWLLMRTVHDAAKLYCCSKMRNSWMLHNFTDNWLFFNFQSKNTFFYRWNVELLNVTCTAIKKAPQKIVHTFVEMVILAYFLE